MEVVKLNILFVEDHDDTRMMFAHLLERWGHTVRIASTLTEARAAAAAPGERFDLLLCDLGLPDGSGSELLRELRRAYPLRAVAMTAYGDRQHMQDAKEAGFNAYLLKPLVLDQLHELLIELEAGLSGVGRIVQPVE